MKRTMKSFLALAMCAVAMGFTSCSKDDDGNPNDGNKEYLFSVRCDISSVEGDESGEIQKQQQERVYAALEKAGLTGESEFPLTIVGKDSISVRKILLEKIAQIEKVVADAPFEINAELSVKGAEKSIIASDAKEGGINIWYNKTFGTPSNADYFKMVSVVSPRSRRYVKWMRTRGWNSDHKGNYWSEVTWDFNFDIGGPYIYLVFEHSGTDNEDFKWESKYENDYITDVIAVKGGGEPQTLYVNGRKYTKENEVCDLNKGVGGDYVWLYACRTKFQEKDGRYYYLTTGSKYTNSYKVDDWESRSHAGSCIIHYDHRNNVDASQYAAKDPYVDGGHRFVERIVPMYDTKGNRVDSQANLKSGDVKGNFKGHYDKIKMILAYATKEGGY